MKFIFNSQVISWRHEGACQYSPKLFSIPKTLQSFISWIQNHLINRCKLSIHYNAARFRNRTKSQSPKLCYYRTDDKCDDQLTVFLFHTQRMYTGPAVKETSIAQMTRFTLCDDVTNKISSQWRNSFNRDQKPQFAGNLHRRGIPA